MPVELVIAPEAESDIAEAYDWYEGRRAGLGEEFLIPRVRPFVRRVRGAAISLPRFARLPFTEIAKYFRPALSVTYGPLAPACLPVHRPSPAKVKSYRGLRRRGSPQIAQTQQFSCWPASVAFEVVLSSP